MCFQFDSIADHEYLLVALSREIIPRLNSVKSNITKARQAHVAGIERRGIRIDCSMSNIIAVLFSFCNIFIFPKFGH